MREKCQHQKAPGSGAEVAAQGIEQDEHGEPDQGGNHEDAKPLFHVVGLRGGTEGNTGAGILLGGDASDLVSVEIAEIVVRLVGPQEMGNGIKEARCDG